MHSDALPTTSAAEPEARLGAGGGEWGLQAPDPLPGHGAPARFPLPPGVCSQIPEW